MTKTEEMEKHHIKVRVLDLNSKPAVSTVAGFIKGEGMGTFH